MLQAARPGPQEPPGTRGRTAIADGMMEKIAGIAAQEVPGLNTPGGGFTRIMGAVRDRVPGGRPSAGREVKVEVGEKQTATDPQAVVEYGVSITEVAAETRENVIAAVERMTGLEVVEATAPSSTCTCRTRTRRRPARAACTNRETGRGKDSAPSLLCDRGTVTDCRLRSPDPGVELAE